MLYFISTILIGIWIYKDAKKREMDAVLWTLLALFLPSYIGVIVYFASRSKEKLYVCPQCGSDIRGNYSACPICALQFKRQCTSCGLICDEKWNNCPRCSSRLTPMIYPLAKPIEKKDHLIRNIVLLIVANIVLFLGVFVGSFVMLFKNADVTIDDFQIPYIEGFDDFEIYPGEIYFDMK